MRYAGQGQQSGSIVKPLMNSNANLPSTPNAYTTTMPAKANPEPIVLYRFYLSKLFLLSKIL
jgi:hypothetical protein